MRDGNKGQSENTISPPAASRFFAVPFLLLTCAFVFGCPAQTSAQSQFRLSAIRARLFYSSTGEFSEDVFGGRVDLWNSPFDSTYSTFVTVEVDGLPEYLDPAVRIELVARYVPFDREKGSLTVRQVETIRNGSGNGKAYAGFWLKRTGCNPVHLSARIVGRKERLREKINFGCGE